jgi:TRAP-type C4-dicarboxylate transport system permease small subunit
LGLAQPALRNGHGVKMIERLSACWAKIELTIATFLGATITLLILLNVISRSLGAAIFWVDELAIYTMIWMTFLASSAALHYGGNISITFMTDRLTAAGQRFVVKLVHLITLVFALFMVWFCWLWFLPLDFFRLGFDVEAFQHSTFHFIYSEPTATLGIRKAWVWLVMWFFALGSVLHSSANLVRSFGQNARFGR